MPPTNEQKDGEVELLHPLDISPTFDHQQTPSPEPSKEAECGQRRDMVQVTDNVATVIIFDWDDTLLASTFLASKGYRLDAGMVRCPDVEAQLRELERSVCSVLVTALQYGDVHIITNAETGWVQLSAQKFIPAVFPLLDKVTILSARSTFEAQFPDAPLRWKQSAFHEQIAQSLAETVVCRNIISFGDSHVEREAVQSVTRGWDNTRTKSVKFAERPSMEQLRRQLDLVRNCFHYIYTHPGDLDLMLTISLMCDPGQTAAHTPPPHTPPPPARTPPELPDSEAMQS